MTVPCPLPEPSTENNPGAAARVVVRIGIARPCKVSTTNSSMFPGAEAGQRIVSSVAEAERIGTMLPLTQTLEPPSAVELPVGSDRAGPSISHRPSMLAIAPGLHAASRDRLAEL